MWSCGQVPVEKGKPWKWCTRHEREAKPESSCQHRRALWLNKPLWKHKILLIFDLRVLKTALIAFLLIFHGCQGAYWLSSSLLCGQFFLHVALTNPRCWAPDINSLMTLNKAFIPTMLVLSHSLHPLIFFYIVLSINFLKFSNFSSQIKEVIIQGWALK